MRRCGPLHIPANPPITAAYKHPNPHTQMSQLWAFHLSSVHQRVKAGAAQRLLDTILSLAGDVKTLHRKYSEAIVGKTGEKRKDISVLDSGNFSAFLLFVYYLFSLVWYKWLCGEVFYS